MRQAEREQLVLKHELSELYLRLRDYHRWYWGYLFGLSNEVIDDGLKLLKRSVLPATMSRYSEAGSYSSLTRNR